MDEKKKKQARKIKTFPRKKNKDIVFDEKFFEAYRKFKRKPYT